MPFVEPNTLFQALIAPQIKLFQVCRQLLQVKFLRLPFADMEQFLLGFQCSVRIGRLPFACLYNTTTGDKYKFVSISEYYTIYSV